VFSKSFNEELHLPMVKTAVLGQVFIIKREREEAALFM